MHMNIKHYFYSVKLPFNIFFISGHHPTDYLVFFRSPDCTKSIDKNIRTNVSSNKNTYAKANISYKELLD